jgi:lipopolysaccharide export LptBFGC system permease protein LptF
MDLSWFFLAIFLASLVAIITYRIINKDKVKAQFLGIGILAILFYTVCFLSGICTILNFLWKWIL